jgi:hypothetical protein
VKVVGGALACLLAGALLGAAIGWAGNPKPVEVPDAGLGFVNYLGPIVGGSVGATFGLILGGGWVARVVNSGDAVGASRPADGASGPAE